MTYTMANPTIYQTESLSSKAKAVFLNLVYRSNRNNTCFPGLKRIAKECGISISSVQRGIRELISFGLLIKEHRFRPDRGQTSNLYTLANQVGTFRPSTPKQAPVEKQISMKAVIKEQSDDVQNKEQSSTEDMGKVHILRRFMEMCKKIHISFALKNTHLTRGASQNDQPRNLAKRTYCQKKKSFYNTIE